MKKFFTGIAEKLKTAVQGMNLKALMKKIFCSAAMQACVVCLGLTGVCTLLVLPSLLTTFGPVRFQDVTMELGDALPAIEAFLTEHADPAKAQLVTPADTMDLTTVGQKSLVFRHGRQEQTVTLTVVDTTAPVVEFKDLVAAVDSLPQPEDFVASVTDKSATTVAYVTQPQAPDAHGEVQVEIVVTDASGNAVTGQCNLRYTWMHEAVTLELGQTLELSQVLLRPEQDSALVDPAVLATINAAGVGTYTITSTSSEHPCTCTVTIQDTTPPTLELKELHMDIGDYVGLQHFIKTAKDASGPVTTRLVTKLDLKAQGTQTVVIEAEDINGNKTTLETKLHVYLDSRPPAFTGVDALTVEKNANVDFYAGVKATDGRDGTIKFTVDASKVNLAKPGTYYAVYTATDARGNKATVRRKITVNHDQEDTNALVASIAATLNNDWETIRNYVRYNIGYNTNWGGDDPVWYGFTTKTGNCYVHALCLQRLLELKGYTTQLIWVTNKSHYWLLIQLDGKWWHIDATPGELHSRYSLMTDDLRAATLSGRDWDRTQWPACN